MKIIEQDPWLEPYRSAIERRQRRISERYTCLTKDYEYLAEFATGHRFFGMHLAGNNWIIREWAPSAKDIFLIGDFNGWNCTDDYKFTNREDGIWELIVPVSYLAHLQKFKLRIFWNGGQGDRIPAWSTRVIQDEDSAEFYAQVWNPLKRFKWKYAPPDLEGRHPLIYEAHVGMATEEYKVGTFKEFREHILPRIIRAGYNTLQLMAIQEHPYYGSFGYHVSSLFAVSSRFGTPDELKELIDEAHLHGLAVIMDIVHSHGVKNELEGLGNYAGDPGQFFHTDHRREHVSWDSLCYDYGKREVLHFLLSNIRFWLEEYRFDGFRFDGVTSMLYFDHGLNRDFSNYDMYFDGGQDEDAIIYLALANTLINEIKSDAISIAEDMSGYPGLAAPVKSGGIGFSHRLSMGIPDYWIKSIKERSDEHWKMDELFHELTSKRAEESTIAYAESHDQALVGDKTIIFRLIDQEMYWKMEKSAESMIVDRGIALHKMIRLITISTSGGGYLNFMGNEFGHPEWIDFPREGNNWSYQYARRQWSLVDNNNLKYQYLADFDREMILLISGENILSAPIRHIKSAHEDLVIAFERSDHIFIFNFHPEKSYTDYGIAVDQGKYQPVICTDESKFGGFHRVDLGIVHRTMVEKSFGYKQRLNLYLPARTALVLKRIPIPRVR